MRRSLRCHRKRLWRRTGSYVRYVTKGFREIRTFSFTGGVTTCHGSYDKGPTKRCERRSTSARRTHASTMTLPELLETSPASRSTSAENMERRNGSVTSAPRNTQSNLTGKLTPKPVELENTNVIVVPYSPGTYFNYYFINQC